ncbi:hypothetical protein PPL_09002 [Heterostelium album PN500]|uniref:Uncharacterized protein n=1 Tax=Heterostelium pallidum (strain ATCC 26659 / Pp 5 / PN500) TaxID=670386 RepID=D3BKC1_HETP5|nr:hypothetical protein PPL_09002 [Heterostelium album PN500]EFA78351.1 hypothetical protein PPL_09002 [Heterostelium album PN500]|eukprot:XP_020430476.1 hypothetical protein PPL_09002 [Heterostelium album PN500]
MFRALLKTTQSSSKFTGPVRQQLRMFATATTGDKQVFRLTEYSDLNEN